jgi:hypothetical protein
MKINRRLVQLIAITSRIKGFPDEIKTRAVAITATEMQFRPFLYRLTEYIYACLLFIFRKDLANISLGISQISIRHYQTMEGVSQSQALLRSMSARENLRMCCRLIEKLNCKNLEELRQAYNGKSTAFYRYSLQKNYTISSQLMARQSA